MSDGVLTVGQPPLVPSPRPGNLSALLHGLAGLRSTLEHPGCSCTDFAGLSLDRHIMMGEALYNVASNARKKLLPSIAMCINIERRGYHGTIPNKNTE